LKVFAVVTMYSSYSHEISDTMFYLVRSKNIKSYWIRFANIAIQKLFQETYLIFTRP